MSEPRVVATVETPQPRDRVRWSRTRVVEGVVEEITSDGLHIRAEDGRLHLCQVEDATVEVLERADDPSKDPEGTQRLVEYDCEPPRVFTAGEEGAFDNRWVALNGATYSDAEIAGSKVIGAYPGTPAAEVADAAKAAAVADVVAKVNACRVDESARPSVRVENTPGPPADVRAKIRRHIEDGDEETAVVVAQNAGIADARSYVEATWEYLSQHSRTEVDAVEADRMRAMGFDRQPEFKVSDEDRASIQAVLDERTTEYVYGQDDGSWKLDGAALTGVVADIVWAGIRRDRERGDR